MKFHNRGGFVFGKPGGERNFLGIGTATGQINRFCQLAFATYGFRHIKTVPIEIETPLEPASAVALPDKVPCIVSILRAGNGMADALSALLPEAAIGHMGLQRDPDTHNPEYYMKNYPLKLKLGR